ncbi:MAG: adenosine deaminase [Pseudomonadota bacterium]
MSKLTYEFIKKLPKTDLHCHLDGSLRVSTILDIAKEHDVELPAYNEEDLKKHLVMDKVESLEEYLKAFSITCSVLQTEDALKRVAFELAEDAALENIRYLEVRYAPILHQEKGLNLAAIVDAVLAGLVKAERKYNIKTGVIICGIRNMNPDISVKLAELCVAYKNKGVLGFDLAGAEEDYPAKQHKEAFYLVLNNNVNVTIHAGEAYGPASIAQAIHYCGAHRIGHGIRLKEDGDLLNYVNDHRIPLEICLTSNIQTNSVKNFDMHPLRFFYDYGLRVTLNTDNRLISDTTMTDEFLLAHEKYNFSYEDLKKIIIDSCKSAFLSHHEKVTLLLSVLDELKKLDKIYMKEFGIEKLDSKRKKSKLSV